MSKKKGCTLPASITGVPDLRRSEGGQIIIEDSPALRDLLNTPTVSSKYVRTVRDSAPESVPNDINGIKLHQREEIDNAHLLLIEKKRERREALFPVLLANVEKSKAFLSTVEKEMDLAEEAKRNKVRRQFEEWNTQVHGTITQRIAKQIDAMDRKALNRRKNDDYEAFLQVTNRKPAIFRDIIIESEYDPLEPNRHALKARTGRLVDPVKLGLQKASREANMLGGPVRKEVLGKNTLAVEQWAAGKIEATPYGTFAKMMSDKGAQQSTGQSATMKSSIHFDHFAYPRTNAAADQEMPKGKRIFPSVIYSDPGRVFGHLPPNVEREIAEIRPPEDRRPH